MAFAVRHFVAAAALLAAAAYISVYGRLDSLQQIRSDGYSYYVYLPSAFLYHDLTLEKLKDDWYGGLYPEFTGIRRWPVTGRLMNLHPIGTAVLIAPFFFVADFLSRWSNLPRDGFSLYYQHGAAIAGLVYFLFGLAIVRRMLQTQFSDGVVLATLICLTWGTNLFHYGVFDSVFSHAYAFFLVSLFVWQVEEWWDRPTRWRSLAIGAIAGLNFLVRHTNAIFVLVLPLYGILHWRDVSARFRQLTIRWRMLTAAAVAGLVVALPQLALYKWITGRWFVSAYDTHDMGFDFGAPHLVAVLFSTQKGLFFWSPILVLSVVGVFLARGRTRALILPAVVLFALQTYLIASWAVWQFGASFGHRGFTDGFALAAPFIAATFEWVSRHRRIAPLAAMAVTAVVLLSVAQMFQYWLGILPLADTTWAQYQELFLKFR
ncbi:MAG TPA: hypothetical protein VGG73_01360 [Vicinamibacterales bacterium]|jgi:hypothetical protein